MSEAMTAFVRTIRRRNIRESAVAAVLIVLLGADLWRQGGTSTSMVGRVVLILGLLGILAVLWGVLHIPSQELTAFPPEQHPERWRRHMTVQARLLRLAWLWYVLPLMLGMVLSVYGAEPRANGLSLWPAVAAAMVGAGIAWLNVAAARSIERDRDRWFQSPRDAG